MLKVAEGDRIEKGDDFLNFGTDETETGLPAAVSKLRERLKDDKFCLKKDDEFLAKFIRTKNYDVERARTSIRLFYKFIDSNPDVLPDIRPTQFKELYEQRIVSVLRGRSKSGSRIVLVKPEHWDTSKHSVSQIRQSDVLLFSETIEDPQTQLNGFSVILDLTNLSWRHVKAVTTDEIKRFSTNVQNGFPIKIASVHLINYPTIFWATFYVAQRLIKEKLRKRIHLHSGTESLQEYFNVVVLPICLNGRLELEEAMDQDLYHRLLAQDKSFQEYYS